MGYNRSGDARKARLKRHKKEMERLARTPRPTSAKGSEAKPSTTKPAASPEPAP